MDTNMATSLSMLKHDLQMLTDSNDEYLTQLLQFSEELIKNEGIKLSDDIESNSLVSMYAAYLFRKRAGKETSMPRFLRYALNNRLFKQKAGG